MKRVARPKFVQIATTVIGGHEYLYALDEDGGVWWLDPVDDDQWTDLTKKRRGDRVKKVGG